MIPKNIYITHETYKDLYKYEDCIKHTLYYNPNYKIHFYNSYKREKFIKDNYPEFHYYYNLINDNYGAVKADIFRVLILHKYGGIYIDCKCRLNSIDEIFQKYNDTDFFTVRYIEEQFYYLLNKLINSKYSNYFLASQKNGFVINKIKDEILFKLQNYSNIELDENIIVKLTKNNILKQFGDKHSGLLGVFNLTGPFIYNKIIKNNLDKVIDVSSLDKQYVIFNSGISMNKRLIDGKDYKNSYHYNKNPILKIKK